MGQPELYDHTECQLYGRQCGGGRQFAGFGDNLQLYECNGNSYDQCKLHRGTAEQPECNKGRNRNRNSDLLTCGHQLRIDCTEVYTAGDSGNPNGHTG